MISCECGQNIEKYPPAEFSLLPLNATLATGKVSGSLGEKGSRSWKNLYGDQSAAPSGIRAQAPNLLLIKKKQSPKLFNGGFVNSSWIGARTHVGRSVGADVQQDGAQIGKNVLFGHVELWKGTLL